MHAPDLSSFNALQGLLVKMGIQRLSESVTVSEPVTEGSTFDSKVRCFSLAFFFLASRLALLAMLHSGGTRLA